MPAARKERTPSGRFMDSINPLLSFSMDEIESMGHEVDDICNESESSSSDDEVEILKEKVLRRRSSRSKSEEIFAEVDQSISELTKESSSTSESSMICIPFITFNYFNLLKIEMKHYIFLSLSWPGLMC